MELQELKVSKILVPEIRITSVWDDDLLDMFKTSVKNEGVQEPIIVLQDNKKLHLVDGLHRLSEAKQNNKETISAIVYKGSLDEVYTKNLMTNRLKGKTKVTEEIRVVKELVAKHKYTTDKIIKKTGYTRERVEDLLNLSGCHPSVLEALDSNEIYLCHAREISRLVDSSRQLIMLQQIKAYKPSCKEMKAIIDDALEMIAEYQQEQPQGTPVPPPRMPLATCHFCEQEVPPQKIFVASMCPGCYGWLASNIIEAKKQVEADKDKTKAVAETIAQTPGDAQGGT